MLPNPLNPDMERALGSLFDKDAMQQLQSLRRMTEWSGAVYDFQLANLKMWPLVLFPHVVKNEIQINSNEKEITFVLKPKAKAKKPSNLKTNLAILDFSVRKLLGRDWLIVVKVGKIEVHRGEKHDRVAVPDSIAAS